MSDVSLLVLKFLAVIGCFSLLMAGLWAVGFYVEKLREGMRE